MNRIQKFKELRLSTTCIFTQNLSVMPAYKEDYYREFNNYTVIDIEKKDTNNYIDNNFNRIHQPIIMQSTGNICNECKGTGWKTCNKSLYLNNLKMNFGYKLCGKCKGTGLI